MPQLTVIAGPNGSGKSTLTRNIQLELNVPVVDPDAEAKKINNFAPESVALTAGKQALRLAKGYLANNDSFAVETTLAGNTYLKMMQQAKQQGYEVSLLFIGINNVNTNIERVADRVATGGHNVPEEDIRRRYERSMANLPIAVGLANNITIFDNSTSLKYQAKLTIENAKITQQAENLPKWLTDAISQKQIQLFQSGSIAQFIYPIARDLINTNQNLLVESSSNIFELVGKNYKLILNQNDNQLSLFNQGQNSLELARYNTVNGCLIATRGLSENDLSNWNQVQQELQQNQSSLNASQQQRQRQERGRGSYL
jgi:predicted ABC-type ATPase